MYSVVGMAVRTNVYENEIGLSVSTCICLTHKCLHRIETAKTNNANTNISSNHLQLCLIKASLSNNWCEDTHTQFRMRRTYGLRSSHRQQSNPKLDAFVCALSTVLSWLSHTERVPQRERIAISEREKKSCVPLIIYIFADTQTTAIKAEKVIIIMYVCACLHGPKYVYLLT